MRGVLDAAGHVHAGGDHVGSDPAPGQILYHTHLEEVVGGVDAKLVDAQLGGNLQMIGFRTERSKGTVILKVVTNMKKKVGTYRFPAPYDSGRVNLKRF